MRSLPVRLRFLVLALVAAIAAVGCAEDGPDREEYVAAVEADLLSSEDEQLPLEEEQASCVAAAVVDAADPERLDDADISPEAFAAAEFADVDIDADPAQLREDLAASLQECSLGAPLTEVMVAEFPFELRAGDQDCIADTLDGSSELAEGVAGVLVDDDESALTDALTLGLAECPSVVGDLLAERITEAGFPVDDAARTCITRQIAVRGQVAIEQILGPGATRLGTEIADACLAG